MAKWIQKATDKMKAKGTVGSFTKAAKRAGKSPAAFQKQVLAKGSKASTKMKRKAAFRKAVTS